MSAAMPGALSRLLTIQQVAKHYGVAVRTVRRWEAQGQIPRGVRVTRGTIRWREEDIEHHMAALKPQLEGGSNS